MLHPLAGMPLVAHVIEAARAARPLAIAMVVGHGGDAVEKALAAPDLVFVRQDPPRGTGDAVRPAEAFANGESFLMINSDNFYPTQALEALRRSPAPAVAVFERDAMLAGSNIPADRISKFSVVLSNPDGSMKMIIEKPDADTLQSLGNDVFVSMNCWVFSPRIFDACRAIKPSPRGEYEITDAAQYCIDVLGEKLAVHKIAAPVLDLSSRGDIAAVNEKLKQITVNL